MATSVRIDGCTEYLNKKPDLIIETQNNYIRKYHSQNLTRDSSDDEESVPQRTISCQPVNQAGIEDYARNF